MEFTFNSQKFAIWFRYTQQGERRETLCVIDVLKERDAKAPREAEPFAIGSSECSIHDRFEKAIGREVALQRAIRYAIKTKGQTHEFWNAAMKAYQNRAHAQRKEVTV